MSALSGLRVLSIVVTDLIYTFPDIRLAGRIILTHCVLDQAAQGLPACTRLEECLLSHMTEVAEDMAQYARSRACNNTIRVGVPRNPWQTRGAGSCQSYLSTFSLEEKYMCYSKEGVIAHLPTLNRKSTLRLG